MNRLFQHNEVLKVMWATYFPMESAVTVATFIDAVHQALQLQLHMAATDIDDLLCDSNRVALMRALDCDGNGMVCWDMS